MSTTLCEKTEECFDEVLGDAADAAKDSFDVDVCIDQGTPRWELMVEACEDWSARLASKCIRQLRRAECEGAESDTMEACEDLGERCEDAKYLLKEFRAGILASQ